MVTIICCAVILFAWFGPRHHTIHLIPAPGPSTSATAAVAMGLLAISVLSYLHWSTIISVAAAAVAGVIAVAVGAGHLNQHTGSQINGLVMPSSVVGQGLTPAAPAGVTATTVVCLLAFSVAAVMLGLRRAPNLRPAITTFAGAACLIAFYGQALGIGTNESGLLLGVGTRVPTDTALMGVCIAAALICAGIEYGWTRIQVSEYAGGRLSRVLVPAILVFVFLTSLFVKWFLLGRGTDSRISLQINIAIITLLMLAVSVYLAHRADVLDRRRERTLDELRLRVQRSEVIQQLATTLNFPIEDGAHAEQVTADLVRSALPQADAVLILRQADNPTDHYSLEGVSHRNPLGADILRDLFAVPAPLSLPLDIRVIHTGTPAFSNGLSSEPNVDPRNTFITDHKLDALAVARIDQSGRPEGLIMAAGSHRCRFNDGDLSFVHEAAKVLGLALTADLNRRQPGSSIPPWARR